MPSSRARTLQPNTFFKNERYQSGGTKQLVKGMLAQLDRDGTSGQGVWNWPPTAGPRRVIRRKTSLLQIPPHVHHPRKGGEIDLRLQRSDTTVEMDHHNATAVKGMDILPGNVHPWISTR